MRLYKYCSLATKAQMMYVCRMIENREIFCADPSTFNDPFDCNIATHLKGFLKKLGVACFSGDQADNVLMFSHYADRHRGIALVFDVVTDGLLGELSFLGFCQKVNYVDDLSNLLDCKNDAAAHKTVLTKYKKWEYENEYRVFADLDEIDPSPIRHYECGELTGVIFGLHTPSADRLAVESWLGQSEHKNIWLQKAELAKDSFALILRNINGM